MAAQPIGNYPAVAFQEEYPFYVLVHLRLGQCANVDDYNNGGGVRINKCQIHGDSMAYHRMEEHELIPYDDVHTAVVIDGVQVTFTGNDPHIHVDNAILQRFLQDVIARTKMTCRSCLGAGWHADQTGCPHCSGFWVEVRLNGPAPVVFQVI